MAGINAVTLDIRNFTRRAASGLPLATFSAAAETVLPGWELSLVFAGEVRAQKLNVLLRGKDYVPNVLSYEVGNKSGEIIICPVIAARQASLYGMPPRVFTLYLFIHGLYHLKGLRHGATMDRYERALLARLVPRTSSRTLPTLRNGTTHRNRHRYRDAPDESRRRRRGGHA